MACSRVNFCGIGSGTSGGGTFRTIGMLYLLRGLYRTPVIMQQRHRSRLNRIVKGVLCMSHWLANKVLLLLGWRAEGSLAEYPTCVVVVAPHTSNWDFPVMLLLGVALRLKATWMGKHTLF